MSVEAAAHLRKGAKVEQTRFPSPRRQDIFGTLKILDGEGTVTLFVHVAYPEFAGVEFLDELIDQAEQLKGWLLEEAGLGVEAEPPAELPAVVRHHTDDLEVWVEQWYSCEDPRYGQTHLWSEKVPEAEAHGVTVHRVCPEHGQEETTHNA